MLWGTITNRAQVFKFWFWSSGIILFNSIGPNVIHTLITIKLVISGHIIDKLSKNWSRQTTMNPY